MVSVTVRFVTVTPVTRESQPSPRPRCWGFFLVGRCRRRCNQKLSLGSFLRPKSKEFVVCHDPEDCVLSLLIADLISESAHMFRAVAPVLGIIKMGLVGHARLRQRRGGPSSTSISGPLFRHRLVIVGNPDCVSDGARLYLLLKKKMSGQERTTRIHSRNPSAPG